MKPNIDWLNISDLSILPHQELDWIEYKGRRTIDLTLENVNENTLKNDLSKAISAFSNTGGGYLLLGINNSTYSIDDNGISLLIKPSGTKQWLEDIIPTLVDPTLIGFNVIEKTSTNLREITITDRAIYIVDIPDSSAAPHQANDNKYYGRIGGKSKPLPHRFIMDILGREKEPNIVPQFCITQENGFNELMIILENHGKVMGRYVMGFVSIPKFLIPIGSLSKGRIETIDRVDYFVVQIDNIEKEIIDFRLTTPIYGHKMFIPILNGINFFIKQTLLSTPFRNSFTNVMSSSIFWSLAVDNTTEKKGEITFKEVIEQSKNFDPNKILNI